VGLRLQPSPGAIRSLRPGQGRGQHRFIQVTAKSSTGNGTDAQRLRCADLIAATFGAAVLIAKSTGSCNRAWRQKKVGADRDGGDVAAIDRKDMLGEAQPDLPAAGAAMGPAGGGQRRRNELLAAAWCRSRDWSLGLRSVRSSWLQLARKSDGSRLTDPLFCDHFHRLRLNRVFGPFAGVFSPATREATDRFDTHVVVTTNLAAQANASDLASSENNLLGFRHQFRLPSDKLHPAGRAPGISATGMKLIDTCLIGQGQDKTLVLRYIEGYAIHGQFRHFDFLFVQELVRRYQYSDPL
jgi:hypothetical protein